MVQVHEESAPIPSRLRQRLDQFRFATRDNPADNRLYELLDALVDAVEAPAGLCPTCASWARDPVAHPGTTLAEPHHPTCPDRSPFERMAARARELLDAADLNAGDLVRYQPVTGKITATASTRGGAVRDLGTVLADHAPVAVLLAAAPDLALALIQTERAWRHERTFRERVEREADVELRALRDALHKAQGEALHAEGVRRTAEWRTAERDAAVRLGEKLRAACGHYLQALQGAAEALDAQNLRLPPRARKHIEAARALVRGVFPSAEDAPVADDTEAAVVGTDLAQATAELVAQVKELDFTDLQELARTARATAESEGLHRIACDLYRDVLDALVAHIEVGDLTAARSLVSALPRDAKGPRPPVTLGLVFALREAWQKTRSPDAAEPR